MIVAIDWLDLISYSGKSNTATFKLGTLKDCKAQLILLHFLWVLH